MVEIRNMPSFSSDRAVIDHLRDELYAKKQWLDAVIAGLEAALDSPQHQLIVSVADALVRLAERRPFADLDEPSRSELMRLVRSVRPRRRRAPKEESKGSAAQC